MGCPFVSVPLFADQSRNAQRAEELGLGVHIPNPNAPKFAPSLEYVSQKTLVKAVDAILTNPAYAEACAEMKKKMRERHLHFQRQGVQEMFAFAESKQSAWKEEYEAKHAKRKNGAIVRGIGGLWGHIKTGYNDINRNMFDP